MITLFYILIILAVWHFVYEAILLPSIRWNLRNELFALRDRLRNVVIENQKHDKTVLSSAVLRVKKKSSLPPDKCFQVLMLF